MDLHRILVPCDFSEYSEKAFHWALEIAEKWRAQLFLLHVIPWPSYPAMLLSPQFDAAEFETTLRAAAENQVQEFVARQPRGTAPLEVRVVLGEPFSDICARAEEENIDLIVMGSHGRTGMSHVWLGSVAERVVRLAPCPVLVVGKKAAAEGGRTQQRV